MDLIVLNHTTTVPVTPGQRPATILTVDDDFWSTMSTRPPFSTSLGSAPRRALRANRGESFRLVDEELGGARNVDVHVNHLAAGSGPGPRHYHQVAENIYIVLSGVIEVDIEGDVTILETDDVLFIPPGSVHGTSNPGPDTAIFIEVYAPAGHDFHIVAELEED